MEYTHPEIVHCRAARGLETTFIGGCTENVPPEEWNRVNQGTGGEISWLDWLVEVEASRNFLATGLGGSYESFTAFLEHEISNNQPAPTVGATGNPSIFPGSPEFSSVGFGGGSFFRNSDDNPEVRQGDPILSIANDAVDTDPGGYVSRAEFYFDENGDGYGIRSELIGTDYSDRGGWQQVISTSTLPLGTVNIIGYVFDNDGNRSAPQSNFFTIVDRNTPPPELPSQLPSPREVDYQIIPHRDADITYTDVSQELIPGRIDYWAISPTTGGNFEFETLGTTDTVVGIYDFESGDLLDFDVDNGTGENGEINFTLESQRAYIVAIASQNGDEGHYDFEITGRSQDWAGEFDDLPAPLYTQTLTGEIETVFGFDIFEIEQVPQDATSVTVVLTPNESLDGWLRIADEFNNTLANSFIAGSGEEDVIFNLPIDATIDYRVTVSSVSETVGTYELEVDFGPDESGLPPEVDAWPNALPLIPLHTGQLELSGLSIDDPNEFDFYYVTANSLASTSQTPKTYTFETFGDLDTQIGVYSGYDEFGSDFLAGDDDSGVGENASITLDLESSQRYVILVRSDASETGEYGLRVQRPPEERVEPIFINGLESKGVQGIDISSNNSRYHMFEVTAPANATEVSLVADLTDAPTDISMRVHDSAGNILAFVDENAAGGDEELLNFAVTAGETYYITINNKNFEGQGTSPRLFADFDPNFETDDGNEFVVNTTTFDRQLSPVVDQNSSGQTVVVWDSRTDQSGSGGEFVFFQRLDVDGSAVGQETLVASSAFNATVSMRDSGEFVVAWVDDDSGFIRFRRFNSSGGGVGSTITTNFTIGDKPSIALKDDGELLIVGTFGEKLSGQIFNANNSIKTPAFTIDKTEDQTDEAVIAIDSNGNYVVVHESIEDDDLLLLTVIDANGQFVELQEKYEAGEVRGVWFDDANSNGGFDSDESPISGQLLFLDRNMNGVRDGSEPLTTTDSEGRYLFQNVSEGLYEVRAVDGTIGAGAVLFDDFNRSDSSDLGPDWIERIGDFAISNSQLLKPGGGYGEVEYVPYSGQNVTNQSIETDFEFNVSNGNPIGTLVVYFGDRDSNSTISVNLSFAFSGGNQFSRITFRDSRYSGSRGWERLTGGESRIDVSALQTGKLQVSIDRDAGTISLGIDTNNDGAYEIRETRGGIDFEGVGEKVYVGAADDLKLDNLIVDNARRFVGAEDLAPGAEVPLLADRFEFQKEPDIAAFPDGGFVVTYETRDFNTGEESVRAQVFDSIYSAVGTQIQVNTNPVHPQWDGNPAVTGLSQGRFVVSWENNDFDDENGNSRDGVGIAAQRFNPDGSKFGPELQLNQFLPGQQKWSDIASDGEENLFAVWQGGATVGLDEQDGSVEGVIGRPLTFTGILEPELEVNDSVGAENDRHIDFGELMVGASQQSRSFTIENEGNATLTVSGLQLVGDEDGVFSLTGPGDFVLAPGESQFFSVSFDPSLEGSHFASVTFEHDDISDSLGTDTDSSPHWISLRAEIINDPRLEVSVIPGVVREDSGFSAGSVVVSRLFGDTSEDLDVVLSSSDTTEARVPVSVTIPGGESSVVVTLEAIDDNTDDGTQVVDITATANGYLGGTGSVDVLSVNHAPVLEDVDDFVSFLGSDVSVVISASDIDTPVDTLTYSLSGGPADAQIDPATGVLTWAPTNIGTFAFTVIVTDDNQDDPLTDSVEFSVEVRPNPQPVVSINDDSGSKSIVDSLSLTFAEVLNFGSDAFELIQRGPDGGQVAFTASVDDSAGYSVVSFQFSGDFSTTAGSLVDGNYQLTVFGAEITDSAGVQLDADADGVAGGNFVFGDEESDNFFRLYGDTDGNRIVNVFDLLAFRRTFLETEGSDDFNPQLDSDGDGIINVFDLLEFRRNFLETLDFS